MQFEYMNHKVECSKCGGPILVEMGLFGIPHHGPVSATHADCIDTSSENFSQFEGEHPEEAREIREWLEEVNK